MIQADVMHHDFITWTSPTHCSDGRDGAGVGSASAGIRATCIEMVWQLQGWLFCLQGLFQPVKLFPFICVTLFVNASPFVGVSNGGLGAQFE